jgi:hypothetical protein
MTLKQVAHFYNTIDEQIVDCQYLMLEQQAAALEALIKNPKGRAGAGGKAAAGARAAITWDSPVELAEYVVQLQAAADRLMTENRALRTVHDTFRDRVAALFGVDLLRQQGAWKDGLLALRTQLEELRRQGYAEAALRPFVAHWDHQLYKALDVQYRAGLESLHELLPEMRVDLVFRQQRLQFRPPLEEIRAKYYRELKRLMQVPERFGGLTGDPALFLSIMDRNAASFATLYRKVRCCGCCCCVVIGGGGGRHTHSGWGKKGRGPVWAAAQGGRALQGRGGAGQRRRGGADRGAPGGGGALGRQLQAAQGARARRGEAAGRGARRLHHRLVPAGQERHRRPAAGAL